MCALARTAAWRMGCEQQATATLAVGCDACKCVAGDIIKQLGDVCSLEVPTKPDMLPPPTATATMLEVSLPF